MRKHRSVLALAAGSIVALVAASAALAVTIVVTPASLHGWTMQHSSCGGSVTGSQAFIVGPATPPTGSGSLQFSSGSNGGAFEAIFQNAFDGTRLADLTALGYGTFVAHFGSGGQAPYLNLIVDNDGNGTIDDQLFFQPILNGTVLLGSWQSWNPLAGQWWSLNGIAGATQGSPKPLSAYLAAQPNARIASSGLRIATGCEGTSWAGFVGDIDALTIGVRGSSTTYDFEAGPSPQPQPQPPPPPAQGHKVAICHKGHTIAVDRHAVPAHMRHGDTIGSCRNGKKHGREHGKGHGKKHEKKHEHENDEDDD